MVTSNQEEAVAANPISSNRMLGYREIGFVCDLKLLFYS